MIKFSKMHGLGNDFMVIDAIHQSFNSSHLPIKQLAHRHLGIGFDQLLLIKSSGKADIYCQIFNADGSEAEQCGNGLRCVTRFVYDKGLITTPALNIETKAGIYHAQILANNEVQVSMGKPEFKPDLIPFSAPMIKNIYELDIAHHPAKVQLSILSMGNPHAIMKVSSAKDYPVTSVGALIAAHNSFPNSVNVGFMEIVSPGHIRLRTYERGSGETYTCGSNACAAVVAGIVNHGLAPQVRVELTHGNLWIEWPDKEKPVLMTGPAIHIFDGIITDMDVTLMTS